MQAQDDPGWCEQVIADTRRWLERAVIGLNLCPFAKAVHVKAQVHYAVCLSEAPADILRDLDHELSALVERTASERETTLLMIPRGFADFLEFNAFVARCHRQLRRSGLEGQIQLADFHPDYVFADAEPQDPGNFSNRAPYPTLHLLREDSIARAVEAFPDPEDIYEENIRRLRQLGAAGWHALGVGRT